MVEPATPFTPGWHIEAICEHLEAVTRGEIRNLLINMPPRHMKSLAVSVFWPTWAWITHPELRWLFSSYAQPLSTRDSLKCRRLIESTWYQERWGHVYQLTDDQNQKLRFENDKTGYRIATSVGGAATGEGGDAVIVDDPHSIKQAASDAMREAALIWWDQTMSTRLNDQKTGAKVIVMQRVHERDLSGHVLESGDYEHLMLPAEYDGRQIVTSIGWHDPRTQMGELLWPAKIDRPALEDLKRALVDEVAIAGQLQQRPTPIGGAILKADWWDGRNRYQPGPAHQTNQRYRWMFWDTALEDHDAAAYNACTVVEMNKGGTLSVAEVYRAHLSFPDLTATMVDLAERYNRDGKLREVIIESKVSGISAIQTLQATAPQWLRSRITGWNPPGSKEMRAHLAAKWCSVGMILLPEQIAAVPWLYDFEAELTSFPRGQFKDQVDSFTGIILYLEPWLQQAWDQLGRAA